MHKHRAGTDCAHAVELMFSARLVTLVVVPDQLIGCMIIMRESQSEAPHNGAGLCFDLLRTLSASRAVAAARPPVAVTALTHARCGAGLTGV